MVVLFWISIFFLLYTYALYPLIMYAWAAASPRRAKKRYQSLPVSVVIIDDGSDNLDERLTNLLEQDYPAELIELIVVTHGSGDEQGTRWPGLTDPRVRIVPSDGQIGDAINVGVQSAANDLVVFANPGQRLNENALAELAAAFADREVGAVVGEVVIPRGQSGENAEGVGPHGEYEKLILQMESEVDSVVGANSSPFALRRQLFKALPGQTTLPDFPILMRVARQGYRVVFVRSIRALEVPSSISQEFARRVRDLAGSLQVLTLEKDLLVPTRNRLFFQMVSHRLARLLTPYLLVTALVSNVFLGGAFYKSTLVLQLLFYASALLRFTPLVTAPAGGLIRVAWTFTVHNIAAVLGLWVFLNDQGKTLWNRVRS